MKCSSRRLWLLPLAAGAALFMSGCAQRSYVAVPPPPPPQGPPPLVAQAEQNGFRSGVDDGARDAYNRFRYQPKHDYKFHQPPGYDPRFGPYDAYRGYFRDAYLRGYYKGYYQR
jgi:hypothetical protein